MIFFSFLFLRGVYHKGQPVVGDDDVVTGDKGERVVSGPSLLPATKNKILQERQVPTQLRSMKALSMMTDLSFYLSFLF
jgi:hypothetical protein